MSTLGLSLALALGLTFGPGEGPELEPQGNSQEPRPESGVLQLGPGYSGEGQVRNAQGEVVVGLDLRREQGTRLSLPAGDYTVQLPGGESKQVTLGDEAVTLEGPDKPEPKSKRKAEPASAKGRNADAGVNQGARTLDTPAVQRKDPPVSRSAKRKAAGSLVVPGLGQMLQGQGAKGAGIFLGTLGLVAATTLSRNPPRDPSRRDFLSEGARLGGYGLATGGLMMLWAGQAMDAFAVAKGRRARPLHKYKMRVEVNRMFSLRLSPTPGDVNYLRDWSLSLMGQPARRVFVGASDLSVHNDGPDGATSLQAGVRAGYRFYDRKALWLAAAGGVIGQLSFSDNPRYGDPDAGAQSRSSIDGSASFYAQLELQWFIVDRWSLNLTPRMFVPVGTRRYGRDQVLPSGALSFELGTGVGVQF